MLQIENTMAGRLAIKNGLPQTQKADAANHGLGLTGIRDIAQRYGGTTQVSQQGQVFRLLFSVPLAGASSQQAASSRLWAIGVEN